MALIAVLGLGLLALVVDRFVLGGQTDGASAAAGAQELRTPRTLTDPVATDATTDAGGADWSPATSLNVELARRFERLSEKLDLDPQRVPDAFEPAASWKPVLDQTHPDQPVRLGESEFRRRHTIQAIMVADGRDCAIIGRRLLYLGEVLDGWVLTAIGERTVTFRADGDRLDLELDRDRGDALRRR